MLGASGLKGARLRLSEFRRAVKDEFGQLTGSALLRELVLDDLDGKTADEAIAAGVPPRRVWLALCRANDVPKERWYAVGLIKPE